MSGRANLRSEITVFWRHLDWMDIGVCWELKSKEMSSDLAVGDVDVKVGRTAKKWLVEALEYQAFSRKSSQSLNRQLELRRGEEM